MIDIQGDCINDICPIDSIKQSEVHGGYFDEGTRIIALRTRDRLINVKSDLWCIVIEEGQKPELTNVDIKFCKAYSY
jgi:hypothetical protein